jgi:hypothetical protein
LEDFMTTFAFVLASMLCLSALPALAGARDAPDSSITLAQADISIGPGGVSVGEHDRDRDRRRHERVGEGRDRDRHCKTVTVEEDGRKRTTRECD